MLHQHNERHSYIPRRVVLWFADNANADGPPSSSLHLPRATRLLKTRVSQITVSVRRARPSLKFLLEPGAFVVAGQLGVDTSGDDLGPEASRGPAGDLTVEDQRPPGRAVPR